MSYPNCPDECCYNGEMMPESEMKADEWAIVSNRLQDILSAFRAFRRNPDSIDACQQFKAALREARNSLDNLPGMEMF